MTTDAELQKEVAARADLVIRARRFARAAVARKMEMSKGTFSNFLRGHHGLTLATLVRLADVLEVPPQWLILGKGDLPELPPAPPELRDQRRRTG